MIAARAVAGFAANAKFEGLDAIFLRYCDGAGGVALKTLEYLRTRRIELVGDAGGGFVARRQRFPLGAGVFAEAVFLVEFGGDSGYGSDGLEPGTEVPLGAVAGERAGMGGFGLGGVLLQMASPASQGANIVIGADGCRACAQQDSESNLRNKSGP